MNQSDYPDANAQAYPPNAQAYPPNAQAYPQNAQAYPQHGAGYAPNAETVPVLAQDNSVRSVNNDGVSIESQRESYVDQSGRRVESHVETYQDKNLRKENLRYWARSIIYFLLAVLEVILGLRFIFRLFGANEDNAFILALYHFSHVFVGPFNNIFNDQAIGSKSVFELSTLVAMLIYALIAWGLVALARVLFAPSYSAGQQVATKRSRLW